jgi:prevent-host-death family protein
MRYRVAYNGGEVMNMATAQTFPIDALPDEARQALEQAKERGEPLVLTTNGEQVAAVVGMSEYRHLLEQAALAEDLRTIAIAEAQHERGEWVDHEEALKRFAHLYEETDEQG